MIDFNKLSNLSGAFSKLAEGDTSYDYSLVDALRKQLGQSITNDAGQFLNNNAVSSIPIKINYSKPQASFQVDATGSDAPKVNTQLKSLLDKKYGPAASRILSRSKEPSFSFNLLTVE